MATLDVTLDKLRSTKGIIRVCLTADAANFPRCIDRADAVRLNVPAAAGQFSLPGVPHGRYALAVIHDENGNGRLDTIAGIPREGYGFSRNPVARFGPPRFTAARFSVESDGGVERVRMRYIF